MCCVYFAFAVKLLLRFCFCICSKAVASSGLLCCCCCSLSFSNCFAEVAPGFFLAAISLTALSLLPFSVQRLCQNEVPQRNLDLKFLGRLYTWGCRFSSPVSDLQRRSSLPLLQVSNSHVIPCLWILFSLFNPLQLRILHSDVSAQRCRALKRERERAREKIPMVLWSVFGPFFSPCQAAPHSMYAVDCFFRLWRCGSRERVWWFQQSFFSGGGILKLKNKSRRIASRRIFEAAN